MKSGSPKKRKANMKPGATKPRRETQAYAQRMQANAALLLRVVAYLVQHSAEVAEQFARNGDARIPLAAFDSDVDVGMVVENDELIIAPAPLPPSTAETTP